MAAPQSADASAQVENTPINVARPNWACPHCAKQYGDDLEAATACAEAGPAPEVTEGTAVLVLPGSSSGFGGPRQVLLGRTEVGPVRRETDDGQIHHRRHVLVAGQVIDPARLASAIRGDDDLHILTGHTGKVTYERTPSLASYGTLAKLILGGNAYTGFTDRPAEVPAWADPEASSTRADEPVWWRIPDEAQRAALNTVLGGVLDRICEIEDDKLLDLIQATYKPSRRRHRSHELTAAKFANEQSGLRIAEAHGAPNPIWAMRWLGAHLDEVTAWQARTIKLWAAGSQGDEPDAAAAVVIPAVSYLPVPESLPRNPGKRRMAVMAPYGESYATVRDTVTRQLAVTEPPLNPVPGVPDVTTTIRDAAGRTGSNSDNNPEGS